MKRVMLSSEQCIFVQLRDLDTDENARQHNRLIPVKVAENCSSQCQMAEYCHQ